MGDRPYPVRKKQASSRQKPAKKPSPKPASGGQKPTPRSAPKLWSLVKIIDKYYIVDNLGRKQLHVASNKINAEAVIDRWQPGAALIMWNATLKVAIFTYKATVVVDMEKIGYHFVGAIPSAKDSQNLVWEEAINSVKAKAEGLI
jgi:hypothetical protein